MLSRAKRLLGLELPPTVEVQVLDRGGPECVTAAAHADLLALLDDGWQDDLGRLGEQGVAASADGHAFAGIRDVEVVAAAAVGNDLDVVEPLQLGHFAFVDLAGGTVEHDVQGGPFFLEQAYALLDR